MDEDGWESCDDHLGCGNGPVLRLAHHADLGFRRMNGLDAAAAAAAGVAAVAEERMVAVPWAEPASAAWGQNTVVERTEQRLRVAGAGTRIAGGEGAGAEVVAVEAAGTRAAGAADERARCVGAAVVPAAVPVAIGTHVDLRNRSSRTERSAQP